MSPAAVPLRRYLRRWSYGVALLATVVGLGLASPAVAAASAVATADEGVHLDASVQRRVVTVARRTRGRRPERRAAGEPRGEPWPRRLVRSLRSRRPPRPRSTRGPPPQRASAFAFAFA